MASRVLDPQTGRPVGQPPLGALHAQIDVSFHPADRGVICQVVGFSPALGQFEEVAVEDTPSKAVALAVMKAYLKVGA